MVSIPLTFSPELIGQLAAAIAAHLQKDLQKAAAATSTGNDKITFFTVKQAAGKLNRCEKTILNRIKSGALPASNDGSPTKPQYLISAADLNAFHKRGRV